VLLRQRPTAPPTRASGALWQACRGLRPVGLSHSHFAPKLLRLRMTSIALSHSRASRPTRASALRQTAGRRAGPLIVSLEIDRFQGLGRPRGIRQLRHCGLGCTSIQGLVGRAGKRACRGYVAHTQSGSGSRPPEGQAHADQELRPLLIPHCLQQPPLPVGKGGAWWVTKWWVTEEGWQWGFTSGGGGVGNCTTAGCSKRCHAASQAPRRGQFVPAMRQRQRQGPVLRSEARTRCAGVQRCPCEAGDGSKSASWCK
jgi:hypothetical protein